VNLKIIIYSAEATQASICALCNRVEDPSHIYSRCKHPLLRRLREATFDIQARALERLRTDPGCPTWERSFFRKFHKRSFSHRHDRAETCWNGTLNPSDFQSLLHSRMPPPVSISFAKFQDFRKRFIKFVSLYIPKQQFRWKCCSSSHVSELPSDISPPLFVIEPHPPIDPTLPAFNRLFVRPPLRISHPPIDRGGALPHHHHRETLRRHTSPSHPCLGSDAVTRFSVSLRTIPFHEHLTLQQDEHKSSSSGRVYEDTEPPSPLGLQFHEPPD
jgi:hypothetical protein